MLITLDHTEQLAPDITMFWFKPETRVKYRAGQFIELFLPHDNPDKRGTKRWFTLSSSPTENLVAITTRRAAENGSSFKQKLFSLESGVELDMSMPMGDFTLPKDAAKAIVFVAGGIGITPMRSMVKYLADHDEQRDITLIHAVNKPEDLAFKDLFEKYGLKYIPVVKTPASGWQGETGSLDGQRILDLTGDVAVERYYLSGPEPMVEAFAKGLKQLGVTKKQLITDFFPGYTGI